MWDCFLIIAFLFTFSYLRLHFISSKTVCENMLYLHTNAMPLLYVDYLQKPGLFVRLPDAVMVKQHLHFLSISSEKKIVVFERSFHSIYYSRPRYMK